MLRKMFRFLCLSVLLVCVSLLITNSVAPVVEGGPQKVNQGGAPATESLTPIALRYAPYIYHATDKRGGRQDIISNIDFDGDFVGNNNWENFERFKLKPTVYYAVLETETHYFISYHLFHPRDWSSFPLWLNDTHENDGENMQVVVCKSHERVVLLWTQAHYKSRLYAREGSGIEGSAVRVAGDFQAMDSEGIPHVEGRHAAIFVESQGHGIYGTLDPHSDVILNGEGRYRFGGGSGILFRPGRDGEAVEEPWQTNSGEVPYQLDSITVKLWPSLKNGTLTGDGRLLDGSYEYRDELVEVPEVPRYYDANRFSGPLGRDRGISPFALDFSFRKGTLGALFFNPARRYAEQLRITGPWSRRYIDYPFSRS